MYRFLLKPRWILSHLFVLACVVTFVLLGIWQLQRLDERKAYNAEVLAAAELAPEPLAELVPGGPGASEADVEAVQYRATVVEGTYLLDEQVLVRNRSNGGAPGYWVLTPLVRTDGTAVVVNRGWVPFGYTVDGPWTDFDPPSGRVVVQGMVRVPQERGGGLVSGPADPAEGELRALARVDVGRLQQQVEVPLLPLYVDLRSQEPAQPGALPDPVPEPDLSEGPHLSYALQWFTFALLTMVVYPLLLRRVARRRHLDDAADPDSHDGGDDGPRHLAVGPDGAPLDRRPPGGASSSGTPDADRLTS